MAFTDEQIRAARKKYYDIAMDRTPGDEPEAERLINAFYSAYGAAKPNDIYWFDSADKARAFLSEHGVTPVTSLKGDLSMFLVDYELAKQDKVHTFADVGNHKIGDMLELSDQLARHTGVMYFFAKAAVVVRKAVKIDLFGTEESWVSGNGIWHNESEPFLTYKDGTHSLYSGHHNIRIPSSWISHPEKITVEDVLSEGNAELRRIMVTRMGFERYINERGLKMESEDDYGQLYIDDDIKILSVKNSSPEKDGSQKIYILEGYSEADSAHDAVSASFGFDQEDYRPAVET